MISHNTVLILGAGASAPFGFPIGSKLVEEVYNSLDHTILKEKQLVMPDRNSSILPFNIEVEIDPETKSSNSLVQMMLDLGHTKQKIQEFRKALKQSQLNSVDAFLEHRPEFISIGKLAIANVLLKYENYEAIIMSPDWYKYIWNKLITKYDSFKNNKLSIITYNYDRSLEYYLFNALKNTFGKSDKETYGILKSINIIHVHGKLGDLPWESEDFIEFGEKIDNKDRLLKVSEGIKIIHEDISSNNEFTEAHNLLKNAIITIFLGFGYSETNLKRLLVEDISPATKSMFASGYNLTSAEKSSINRIRPYIKFIPQGNLKCLDFLREIVL